MRGDAAVSSPTILPTRQDVRPFALLAASCVLTWLTFLLPGIEASLCRNFPDDALFYNLLAENILAGRGSTVDGLAQSNGYHPLWLVILTVVEALPGPALPVELVLITLLNVASSWLLYVWLAPFSSRPAAFIVALLATFEQSLFQVIWRGMETSLVVLVLLWLLLLLREGPPVAGTPIGHRRKLSIALVLLFFSRLDGGLFWCALALMTLATGDRNPPSVLGRARDLLVLFLPIALLASVYLAFNYWWFDTAMPISGRVKSIPIATLFSGEYDFADAFRRFKSLLSPDPLHRLSAVVWQTMPSVADAVDAAVFLAFLVLLVVGVRFVVRAFSRDFALRCLVVVVPLHVTYYSLLQSDGYSLDWAKGPELVLMLTVLAVALHRGLGVGSSRPSARWAAAGCLAFVLGVGAFSHARRTFSVERIHDFNVAREDFFAAMRFVHQRIPEREPIISWNIGFLGYFGDRPVVSKDGLLNSRRYYEEFLSRGRVASYMRENSIRYIVNRIPKEGEPSVLLAEQFPGLRSEDLEILAVFDDGVDRPKVAHRYAVALCKW